MTIGEIIKAKDRKTYNKLMKIARKERHKRKEPLYICDAVKNTECKKRSCYINGGVCMMTTDAKFAKK